MGHQSVNEIKYVCAFNRDRDFYQIPLALSEKNKLDKFITDYYANTRVRLPFLGHRKVDGISWKSTSSTIKAVALQGAWKSIHHVFDKIEYPELIVDRYISEHLQKYTKRNTSHLFVYNNYASTFGDPWNRDKFKVLFQFHPAPKFINLLMRNSDIPKVSQEPEVRHFDYLSKLSDIELNNSQHIFCASSFTKKSLTFSGYDPESITVIPYGAPSPNFDTNCDKSGPLKFIFLGSAVRRKGLDLLLNCWPRFHSVTGAQLIVVSRVKDSTILFPQHRSITYSDGLVDSELAWTLSQMDCLILPSLIEGFGLVLTEALSAGLHVIASENTGLVDLNLPSILGTQIENQVTEESIFSALLKAAEKILANRETITFAAKMFALEISWEHYRKNISVSLSKAEKKFLNDNS